MHFLHHNRTNRTYWSYCSYWSYSVPCFKPEPTNATASYHHRRQNERPRHSSGFELFYPRRRSDLQRQDHSWNLLANSHPRCMDRDRRIVRLGVSYCVSLYGLPVRQTTSYGIGGFVLASFAVDFGMGGFVFASFAVLSVLARTPEFKTLITGFAQRRKDPQSSQRRND